MNVQELKARARAAVVRGRLEQAEVLYRQVLTKVPRDAPAWLRHAETLRRLNRVNDAVWSYRTASTILLSLGHEARAIAGLKLALELKPDDVDLVTEIIRLEMHRHRRVMGLASPSGPPEVPAGVGLDEMAHPQLALPMLGEVDLRPSSDSVLLSFPPESPTSPGESGVEGAQEVVPAGPGLEGPAEVPPGEALADAARELSLPAGDALAVPDLAPADFAPSAVGEDGVVGVTQALAALGEDGAAGVIAAVEAVGEDGVMGAPQALPALGADGAPSVTQAVEAVGEDGVMGVTQALPAVSEDGAPSVSQAVGAVGEVGAVGAPQALPAVGEAGAPPVTQALAALGEDGAVGVTQALPAVGQEGAPRVNPGLPAVAVALGQEDEPRGARALPAIKVAPGHEGGPADTRTLAAVAPASGAQPAWPSGPPAGAELTGARPELQLGEVVEGTTVYGALRPELNLPSAPGAQVAASSVPVELLPSAPELPRGTTPAPQPSSPSRVATLPMPSSPSRAAAPPLPSSPSRLAPPRASSPSQVSSPALRLVGPWPQVRRLNDREVAIKASPDTPWIVVSAQSPLEVRLTRALSVDEESPGWTRGTPD